MNKSDQSSLVLQAVNKMSSYNGSNIDYLLSRINSFESWSFSRMEKVKNTYKTKMQSIFDRFYLDQINEFKTSESDELNHNKFHMYATLKWSFKREPYIDLVQCRNQRSWLSRLPCSAHHLEIEKGRWNNVPLSDHMFIRGNRWWVPSSYEMFRI